MMFQFEQLLNKFGFFAFIVSLIRNQEVIKKPIKIIAIWA